MPSRVVAVGVVVAAGAAGVLSGVPTVWSPLNLIGLVPALVASLFLGGASVAVSAVLLGGAFAWWCPDVWTGQAQVPHRSIVLTVVTVVLSLASVLLGREVGVRHQGVNYVNAVTAVSAFWWFAIASTMGSAVWKPSPVRNFWAHWALFVWLGWYALPYLGELP